MLKLLKVVGFMIIKLRTQDFEKELWFLPAINENLCSFTFFSRNEFENCKILSRHVLSPLSINSLQDVLNLIDHQEVGVRDDLRF